ncbi:G patch domain-containing protein 4 [Geranomyces michiganensis]|nr:G patch domain-containing protein 4 [Geranomyces michiganensis]
MPSSIADEENVRAGMGSGFAQTQLAKYGWEKGTGLGKNRDGINKAVSVGFKNDTDGLGAKSDEWSFAWWDHVFNKSAASIKIHKDEDDAVAVSAATDSQAAKKLLYGTFVKATPQEEVIVERKDYSIKVTDEELFLACEGRTARKGARSSQPGKLARAQMSTTTVTETMAATAVIATASSDVGGDAVKRTKKEEKRARKEQRAARRAEKAARRERRAARKTAASVSGEPIDPPAPIAEEAADTKKAKKTKAVLAVEEPTETASVESKEGTEKRKKKKGVSSDPVAEPVAAAAKKEKKRKRREGNDAEEPRKKSTK